MPAVPLQCPHCTGLIQVEVSSAGQQLGCPFCQGAFVVPPEEALWQLLAAAGGMPAPAAPPMESEAFTLACPACTGPFQALASMSGQTVGCPHCGSPVTIPPLAPSVDVTPPVAAPDTAQA